MSKIKLELKDFEHVKSDDHSTTLKHKKGGHLLKLAHKSLGPEAQEQLKTLAQNYSNKPILKKMADGGEAHLPCLNPNCKSEGKSHPNCKCYGGMADGGKVASYCAKGMPHQKDCEYYADGTDTDTASSSSSDDTPRSPDPDEAQKFTQGAQEGQSLSEGVSNIKNEIGNLFKADGGEIKEMPKNPHSKVKDKQPGNTLDYKEIKKDYIEKNKKRPEDKKDVFLAEGGMPRKMYADPDEPVSQDDNTPYSPAVDAMSHLGKVIGHAAAAALGNKAIPGSANKDMNDQITQDQPAPQPQQTPSAPQDNGQPMSTPMDQQQAAAQGDTPAQQPAASQPDQAPTADNSDANSAPPADNDQQPDQSESQQDQGQPQSPYQQKMQDYAKEDQAWAQDMQNGHITPKTYGDLFHYNQKDGSERSTLSKIGMLFGLALSGGGAGVAHQQSTALQMMNNAISNDLEAQKQSKQNAFNYYRQNQNNEIEKIRLQQQAPLTAAQANSVNVDAEAKSRIMMNRAALDEQVKNVMNLPEGPQKEQQKQALGLMFNAVNNENYNIGARAAAAQALLNQGQGTGEPGFQSRQQALQMSGNEALGKFEQDRHIPGIPGQASRPVTEGDRAQLTAMNVLDSKGKDLLNFINQHSGTLNPQQRAVAAQKVEEMKNFYNKSIEGGALTEGRLSWYDKQLRHNPTDYVPQMLGNTQKLKEMVNSNDLRKNILLKSYGYQQPQQSQAQKSNIQEGATGTYAGKPVVYKNGKWVSQ